MLNHVKIMHGKVLLRGLVELHTKNFINITLAIDKYSKMIVKIV